MVPHRQSTQRIFRAATAIAIGVALAVYSMSRIPQIRAEEPIFPVDDVKIRAALEAAARERAERARMIVAETTAEINDSKEPDAALFEDRADAFMVLRMFDKAFEDCTKGLAAMGDSKTGLLLTRARAAAELGDRRQAEKDRDAAVRMQEQACRSIIEQTTIDIEKSTEPNPYLLRERGDAFMMLCQFDKAFDDYTKGILAKNRRGQDLFERRIMAAVGKGDYRHALKDSEGFTRLSSASAESLAIHSLILSRSPDEQVRNAEEALDLAIRATITNPGSRNESLVECALAAAYSVNGNYKAAVLHQERAIAAEVGIVPAEMKAQLEAYKAGKEYPYRKKSQSK